MKRIIKKIISELYSIKFWIAVIAISMLCFCANVEGETASSDTVIYHLILYCSRQELMDMGEMYSSYSVIMAFRNNYWFPIIVPIVAAVPYIHQFSDEWLTGYYYMRIPRSKRVSYAMEHALMAALTGFLVMCVGILLFGMVCVGIFPSYHSYLTHTDESMVAAIYGQTQAIRFISFIKVLLHVGLLGSIMSVFSCIVLTIIRDAFLSLTLPMMLVYLSTKVCNYYALFVRQQYADEPPLAVNMISLLIPSMYMNMEGVFHQWFGVPDFFWHAYLLLILGFLAVIMAAIVKRRDV
ncbi:MAG: hypothetical protein LUH14_07985 [Clostridiaceae bacterium]|nr:hypothetical protein [Clostridiaceae bacterium]